MLRWGELVHAALPEATEPYPLLVSGDEEGDKPAIDPDEAAELCAQILREKTDIVGSVTVRKPSVPDSRGRYLQVVFLGFEDEKPEKVFLSSDPNHFPPRKNPQLISMERFEGFYFVQLKSLSSDGRDKTLEFIGGSMGINRGPSQIVEDVNE